MAQRRIEFQQHFDDYRRAMVCEPRGNDVMVGALLTQPECEGSLAGVIFFNNVGTLGMCGHGTIGVAAALEFLETISFGTHRLDTPVGTIEFDLQLDGRVRLTNVASFRWQTRVPVALRDGRTMHGDVAWGGNWFFICEDHGITVDLENLPQLDALARELRYCLTLRGIVGEQGAEIDHVELMGPPSDPKLADAKNFVMCPGAAYDRSPCGTGTSAKVACLAADGKLLPGQVFRQESIVGSVFDASFQLLPDGRVLPTIIGNGYVNAEGELLLDPRDPFCMGIHS